MGASHGPGPASDQGPLLQAPWREERTMKGFHSSSFQLLVLPAQMPAGELD